MSKKFNGHRCERRNLTDLVLGTGPDGKRRAKPKAKKRPKNYTQEPAANKMTKGGPASPVDSLLGVLERKGAPGYTSAGNMPADTQALMEYVNAAQGRITGGMSPRDAANANAFMMRQQMDHGLPATAQALYGVEQQMYLGGPAGDPIPESGIPTRLQQDPRVMAENMLGLAAGNMMTRFTNPNTGEYYKEYDPRIANYIDDELLGGKFSAKQTDFNYKYLPEGMADKPENYQYFEQGDPLLPDGAVINRLGTAWSAGTVSNLAQAYDPSFEGSARHSDYINRAFQGDGNYTTTRAKRNTDYQVGDIMFQGRGDTKGKGYRAFRKMADDGQGYQSHSDIITSIDTDADGNKIYHVLGGNMGDSLYDRGFTEKELAQRYAGRMTNTGLGMQSAAYQMENNPLFFNSYPAAETAANLEMQEGGYTAPELLEAIKNANIKAAKTNMLGTGLGVAGNLITTMGEGDNPSPTDAYSLTDGLGGALSGAAKGAQFGVPGMIIGGAFGLGKSLYDHHKEKNEFIRAQEEAKEERTAMNQENAQTFSEQVLSTYNQEGLRGGSYYRHGGAVDYETEKNEVILAGPNDPPVAIGQGKYKRKSNNLYEGNGPSHEMGGIPTKGATEPFVDQMGQQQDSPYVFSDAKEMRFDASSILSMIS